MEKRENACKMMKKMKLWKLSYISCESYLLSLFFFPNVLIINLTKSAAKFLLANTTLLRNIYNRFLNNGQYLIKTNDSKKPTRCELYNNGTVMIDVEYDKRSKKKKKKLKKINGAIDLPISDVYTYYSLIMVMWISINLQIYYQSLVLIKGEKRSVQFNFFFSIT